MVRRRSTRVANRIKLELAGADGDDREDDDYVMEQDNHSSNDEENEEDEDEDVLVDVGPAGFRGNKMRVQDIASMSFKLKKVKIRRYVERCATNYRVYYDSETGPCEAVKKLAQLSEVKQTIVDEPGAWKDTLSVPMVDVQASTSSISNLFQAKGVIVDDQSPEANIPESSTSFQLKYLHARKLIASNGLKKPDMYTGCRVEEFADLISRGECKGVDLEPQPLADSNVAVLNCGGPIASVAVCPRTDEEGNEILAVATFPNEEISPADENTSSYVQIWTYDRTNYENVKCRYLLEVPGCIALDLAWCPNFHVGNNNSNDTLLGLLAISTSKGVIFVQRISKQYPAVVNDDIPIISQIPVATLSHPPIDINTAISNGSQTESVEEVDAYSSQESQSSTKLSCYTKIPLFSLQWPPFGGGRKLSSLSEACKFSHQRVNCSNIDRVMVWNLDSPSEANGLSSESHLQNSDTLIYPETIIYDPDWDSPPCSATWVKEDELVVVLRTRNMLLLKVPSGEVLLSEATPRTAGDVVASSPINFDGFLSANTVLCNVDGVSYSNTGFVTIDESYESFVVPCMNTHQLQTFDAGICHRSGIVATCGLDGCLVHSLNGRLDPKNWEDGTSNFFVARPLLQLVRRRRPDPDRIEKQPQSPKKKKSDKTDDKPRPVAFKHEACTKEMWLEVRLGDAALMDVYGVKKHRDRIQQSILDRRIENLTRLSVSPITAGLTAVGGEAGLVFITHTLL